MDIQLLRAFLAIYERGSVSAAAAEIGLSQPGLSTALGRLRLKLGDELFIKTPSGMEPTARAREIAPHIVQALEILDGKVMSNELSGSLLERTFTICISDSTEKRVLPRIVDLITSHSMRMHLKCVLVDESEIEAKINSGLIDLAFGSIDIVKSNHIMVGVVGRFELGWFARAGHPVEGSTVSLSELCEYDHIAVDYHSIVQILDTMFETERLRPNLLLSTAHVGNIPTLLSRSDAVAALPIRRDGGYSYQGVTRLETDFSLPALEAKIYWHRRFHDDPAHRWLRRAIADTLAIPYLT